MPTHKRFPVPRCLVGRIRHYFSHGPVCTYCGTPNPWLADADMQALDDGDRQLWWTALARLFPSSPGQFTRNQEADRRYWIHADRRGRTWPSGVLTGKAKRLRRRRLRIPGRVGRTY